MSESSGKRAGKRDGERRRRRLKQKGRKQAGIYLTSRQCRNPNKREHRQRIKREQCEQLSKARRRSIRADLENNSQEAGTASPLLTRS